MPYVFNLKDLVLFQGSQYAKMYSKKKNSVSGQESITINGLLLGHILNFYKFRKFQPQYSYLKKQRV